MRSPLTSQTPARRPTPFEQRVYDLISCIPHGRVSTYASIGRALGCGSSQATGQALKRNPFAPEVPCHRVIRTDLTMGGYSGEIDGEQIIKKTRLLKSEGVEFEQGRLSNPSLVWEPSSRP